MGMSLSIMEVAQSKMGVSGSGTKRGSGSK